MTAFMGLEGLFMLVFLVLGSSILSISVHGIVVEVPAKPPRTLVAVEGVIYCKSCKYLGSDTLLGATPLPGATVKLRCNNSKQQGVVEAKGTADKNGYFFIQAPPKVTSYAFHKYCKVFMLSSSLPTCNNATNLHGGVTGAHLRFKKIMLAGAKNVSVYTVGPFAFAPNKATPCRL